MSPLFPGRYSAQIDGSFVVFLIGMRINRLLAVHKWLPVARAMGPMVEHLLAHKELGLLHAHPFLYWRGAALVQYWRSMDQLMAYARNRDAEHLPAWRAFNRAIGTDGSVGVWHETYQVQAGQYECVYGNMPPFGLAVAGQHLPAVGKRETARRRMGLQGEPAVQTYDNPPPPV
mgnify:CR=1 FL=1